MLYEYKNGNIDGYSLIPKDGEIKQYKVNVLRRNNKEIFFYDFVTNNIETKDDFESLDDLNIRNFDYDISIGGFGRTDFSEIVSSKENDKQELYIEKYVNGDYDKYNVYDIWDEDGFLIYALIKTQELEVYQNEYGTSIYAIRNMFNLPKSLYLLNLIQKGKYNKVLRENINRQLQLFDLELSACVFSDFDSVPISSFEKAKILRKVEVDSRILTKVRKR